MLTAARRKLVSDYQRRRAISGPYFSWNQTAALRAKEWFDDFERFMCNGFAQPTEDAGHHDPELPAQTPAVGGGGHAVHERE